MRTRSKPNRLGLYDDVRAILDAAMTSGGGTFDLPDHGKAVHWRQRAYQFRKLYADILFADKSTSMSPYDRLSFPKIPKESSTVVIKVREIIGTFTPNREPTEPMEIALPGDELFDVAKGIRDKIQKGEL